MAVKQKDNLEDFMKYIGYAICVSQFIFYLMY